MADKWPLANGNWSNAANWNGGTLPGPADDVYADGRSITIDQNVTVLSLRTTQRTGGTAGGGFTASGFTVNADTRAGLSTVLTLLNGGVQNGSCYGSTTTNTTQATVLNATTVLNGNAYGGNGLNRNGVRNNAGTHNGNAYGSASGGGHGSNMQNGALMNGNAIGGAAGHGVSANLGLAFIFGDSVGGTVGNQHGIDTSIGYVFHYGTATGGPVANAVGTNFTAAGGGLFYGHAIGPVGGGEGVRISYTGVVIALTSTGLATSGGGWGVRDNSFGAASTRYVIIREAIGPSASLLTGTTITDPSKCPFLSYNKPPIFLPFAQGVIG